MVEAIKPAVRATVRPGAGTDIGGFGGLFDLAAAGYRDPILVAATDGVGTKLKIVQATGLHDGIGADLVAMCVNDLVVQGAEPLFFLDYYATARLDGEVARRVIESIAAGCREAGCALIGGETAEMPGMYAPGDYDLAGFAVGAVERAAVLPRPCAAGDVLLGLASSGPHANGFSLIRRIVEDRGLDYGAPAPFDPARRLGEALLAPTRIYVKAALAAAAAGAKALVHVTGGGLTENLPRVLAPGLAAEIDATGWTLPPVFAWLRRAGPVAPDELARTFNCGIGMVAIAAPADRPAVERVLGEAGETVASIGRLVAVDGPAACVVHGTEGWRE